MSGVLIWTLGTELGSSVRAAKVLKYEAIFPVLSMKPRELPNENLNARHGLPLDQLPVRGAREAPKTTQAILTALSCPL